ncbi:MAG TPA: hypothetical protein PLY66_06400 [Acidobacteriota bacterium]|nr:hypothetical protein [Acidobacteriota bacterium]HOT00618.1 hypothetical protein [Acidobacteriota bacterium]HQF86295.1 hypothetical protein [Acidobacteriota bacterium]HQG90462.1 hypothetical protein [Acidobacteriota bacterium]HQK86054.1 hypothetical protein [Acidobacteriota bacterium]
MAKGDLCVGSRPQIRRCALAITLVLTMIAGVAGQGQPRGGPSVRTADQWSMFAEGAFLHQFNSGIDSGGSFGTGRMLFEGGLTYAPDFRRSVSIAVGYDRTTYNFEGQPGIAAEALWGTIHTISIGAFIRYGINREWTLFMIPTLRTTAESGADFGDAITGGSLAGFSYRFGDRLTLGPGIGVITQLEDDPSVFPVLFVNWRITEHLSMETGGGLGATRGPGLVLNWDSTGKWRLFVGGRYEKSDFRLRSDGVELAGIGSNREFPLYSGVVWRIRPDLQVNLIGGVELGGRMARAYSSGDVGEESNYQAAGFVGVGFRFRY